MAGVAHEHKAAIGTIPLVHVSKGIAIVAVINATESGEGVVLVRVNKFGHYLAFHPPVGVTSYQIGLH